MALYSDYGSNGGIPGTASWTSVLPGLASYTTPNGYLNVPQVHPVYPSNSAVTTPSYNEPLSSPVGSNFQYQPAPQSVTSAGILQGLQQIGGSNGFTSDTNYSLGNRTPVTVPTSTPTAQPQFQYNPTQQFTGLPDVQGGLTAYTPIAASPADAYFSSGANQYVDTTQNPMGVDASTVTPDSGFWNMKSFLGSNQQPGWGQTAFQGIQALGGIYSAIAGAKTARDTLNFQKQAYRQNYNQQAQTLNTAMQDRQNARRSSSNSYQDTGSYMAQHGLKSI